MGKCYKCGRFIRDEFPSFIHEPYDPDCQYYACVDCADAEAKEAKGEGRNEMKQEQNRRMVDHDLTIGCVYRQEIRFEDPEPISFMCQCGKKVDRKNWHWVVNKEAMCDKCYHSKWCEPFSG